MRDTIYPEIVKQMKDHKESLQCLTDLIGLKYKSQICRRLSGKVAWTIEDAIILCRHYNMKIENLFKKEE